MGLGLAGSQGRGTRLEVQGACASAAMRVQA